MTRIVAIALMLLAGCAAFAQQADVPTFSVPQSVNPVVPDYPRSQAGVGGEAIVRINFMVDTDGHPFDPVIVESTGDRAFHAPALEALDQTQFVPARLDGEPIVGSATVQYVFVMENAPAGATEEFISAYRNFQSEMESQERDKIESSLALLEKLGAQNHYENAFLNLARYSHARSYGTDLEQMQHLRRALSLSASTEDPQFLDQALVTDLRRTLLVLEVRNNFFAEAIETFKLIEESGDSQGEASFADAIAAVEAVKTDATEYFIPLDLGSGGTAGLNLYKGRFALTGGEGDINQAVLRCDRQYVAFEVERDVSYEVPAQWGDCHIEVIGNSRATVMLMQH